MRACVIHGAEDLRIEDRPDPAPGPGEVLLAIRAGGICGSDLHYFFEGRNGDFVVREPLIPGHEVAGEVVATGPDVLRIAPGEHVAIHPGRACGHCRACKEGRGNLCRNVFFLGSASRFPHMQGGFADLLIVRESQCHKVSPGLPFTIAAFAEPLAVCLHAVSRAGPVLGRTALVTGAGPIGLLTLLCLRRAGAAHITVTDVLDPPLALAARLGANQTANVAADPEAAAHEDAYDLAFECSGSPAALAAALRHVRPGATIIQVGTLPPGSVSIPGNLVMAKEIDLRGAMRFDTEFAHAVECLDRGLIDVRPLLTGTRPASEAVAAFHLARDRNSHAKVQILFN
jgi:L-idonate 5-dehydrogenase